jgi:steroid delta-isomerase-like uncharacterized protein
MSAPAAPTAGASNAELIRWSFEVLNAHDVTPLRAFWTDETVERFPDATCRGAAQIAAYFETLFRAIPDFHMDIVAMAAEGDAVFVRWHLTGTHTGPGFAGLEPTGKRIALDGIDHFTLRDGTVVSNFVVFDQAEVGRILGMLPPDGSAPDRAMKAAFNAKTKLTARLRSS